MAVEGIASGFLGLPYRQTDSSYCQALYFDLRKGAHSIGSNVRDAAAYVIWALARSQDSSTLAPFSRDLAQRLTAVALYDREVHIRRAASAAFQEHVGRNVGFIFRHFFLVIVLNTYKELISLWHRRSWKNGFLCRQH